MFDCNWHKNFLTWHYAGLQAPEVFHESFSFIAVLDFSAIVDFTPSQSAGFSVKSLLTV